MIPATTECVQRTSVWVGDDVPLHTTVEPEDDRVIVAIGENFELVVGEQALQRLQALVAAALQRLAHSAGDTTD